MATTAHASRPGKAAALPALLRSPALALTLATLFWAASFVVLRALRAEIDPVALTFIRWLVSLLILAPFVWREVAAHMHVVLREWRLVLCLGTTGIALFHPLVFIALQHTSATNALLTFSLSPVVILICASIGAGKRPGAWELVGIALSLGGAAVLITRGDLAELRSSGFNVGDLWMLVAVAAWAAYSLLLRRRPADLPQSVTLVSSICVALPILLIFNTIAANGPMIQFKPMVILSIAYIALFASVISFLLWSYGVAELGAARAGQYVHLMPVFGAGLAFLFLGEPLSYSQIAGAALVFSGIGLIEARQYRHPRSRTGSKRPS